MCWKRQKVDDSDTRAEASSVRVRLARAPANRYSPKPSFQPFEIPLRPRAEAEESIFKFVMETSGCNYGKRPNFHHFFFFFFLLPVPEFHRQHSSIILCHFPTRTRHELRGIDANNSLLRKEKRKGERGGEEERPSRPVLLRN